ncbi:MAG: hypothetical protein K1X28_10570 [Parachlamydiales bacterium]|nr:hypothetical protein [Parachlamydiales bacterium]
MINPDPPFVVVIPTGDHPNAIHMSPTRELLLEQLEQKINAETNPIKKYALEWRRCFFNTCCSTDGYGMKKGCCVQLKTKCIKHLSNCFASIEWIIRKAFCCCKTHSNQVSPSS